MPCYLDIHYMKSILQAEEHEKNNPHIFTSSKTAMFADTTHIIQILLHINKVNQPNHVMGLLNIQLKFNLRNRTHHVKSHINCYDLHNPAICIKSRDSIMVQDRYGQSVLKLIVFTGICDYTIHQFSISFRNCTAGCVHGSPTLFSD